MDIYAVKNQPYVQFSFSQHITTLYAREKVTRELVLFRSSILQEMQGTSR